MASSSVIRILDTARLQLPGALEGTLRLEFFAVLKEFFQHTDIWKDEIVVEVEPCERSYQVPNFCGGLITRLMWLEGKRPERQQDRPHQSGSPRQGSVSHMSGAFALLEIYDLPSVPERWHAHFALTVADPTDANGLPTFPDWVAEKYSSYLTSGLVAKCAAHPSKPYSNKDIVALHGRRFEEGKGLAKTEAQHGNVFGGQRWAFPQTFATHSQRNRW